MSCTVVETMGGMIVTSTVVETMGGLVMIDEDARRDRPFCREEGVRSTDLAWSVW